jgi:hypothetical protein
MVTPSVRHPSLAQVIFPSASWLRDLLLVVGGVVFVALLAQIRIVLPFTPVPITGQTLGVILIGATYGVRLGFLTLATYVVVGLGGLPVFAGGAAGLARLFGPTGGYLVAFPWLQRCWAGWCSVLALTVIRCGWRDRWRSARSSSWGWVRRGWQLCSRRIWLMRSQKVRSRSSPAIW